MTRACLCLLLCLGLSRGGAEELVLTGLTQIGSTPRAFFYILPQQEPLDLFPGQARLGYLLEAVDWPGTRALVRHGSISTWISFPADSTNAAPLVAGWRTGRLPPDYGGPWPEHFKITTTNFSPLLPATGQSAAAPYIGALREYRLKLPPDRRAAVDRELQRFASAEPADESAGPTATPAPAPAQPPTPPPQPDIPPPQLASLLERLLTTSPPPPGSLSGGAEEIGALRQLRRTQSDPGTRWRIEEELRAYSSPNER